MDTGSEAVQSLSLRKCTSRIRVELSKRNENIGLIDPAFRYGFHTIPLLIPLLYVTAIVR